MKSDEIKLFISKVREMKFDFGIFFKDENFEMVDFAHDNYEITYCNESIIIKEIREDKDQENGFDIHFWLFRLENISYLSTEF